LNCLRNTGFLLMLLALLSFPLFSQVQIEVAFPNLSFTRPVDLQHPGDGSDRIFVVEQQGIIYTFQNDSNTSIKTTFLDIRDRVDDSSNEEGLLGLAFHPDYENNGYFYVNYTATNPNRTVIARYPVSRNDPDMAEADSELVVMEIPKPYSNHNAGQLAFGPDRYLYISAGDGGSGGDPQNNGQNLATLLGSILRINVDSAANGMNYSIPADNPYFGNSMGYREEIYANGLRNVWRFSFDPVTNWLWAADVGQNSYEEVNISEIGKNYGWRIMEGFHCYDPSSGCDTTGLELPIWEYDHGEGQSITGGYVYRGIKVPELYGKYIYADFISGRFWSLDYDGVNVPVVEEILNTNLLTSSFGVDKDNELYICSFDGKIYRFKPTVTKYKKSSIEIPKYFRLEPNYPNPFNPDTTIPFNLEKQSLVEIRVFDISGNHIKTLTQTMYFPGDYSVAWDGTDENGNPQPTGIYFVKMTVDQQFSDTHRMVLVK